MNQTFYYCRLRVLLAVLGLWIAQGCTKVVSVAPLRVPDNIGDTTRDVRKMLDSVPQFSLFAYACSKAGITAGMQPGALFTLFVPTDSAMQAAGLNRGGIDQLSPDSLAKIVRYHITYGVLSDTALNGALVSVQQNCLLTASLFSPQGSFAPGYSTYRYSLYAKAYKGLLSLNGWVVNAGEASVPASNGYLYAIHRVLIPPTLKLSDIVFTRPEFSYYATAIETLDSIYRSASYNGTDQPFEDTVLFSQVTVEESSIYPGYGNTPISRYPTVFAPTNTAFVNAGLADQAAVKRWILTGVRVDTIWYDPYNYQLNYIPGQGFHLENGNLAYGYNFAATDSIIKSHYLLPTTELNGQAFASVLCYNDLTECPAINSGVLNQSSVNPNFNSIKSLAPFALKYHADANGVLSIQWNPAGTKNAVVPLDESQAVQRRSFWTMNGVVYATDQLFYQP